MARLHHRLVAVLAITLFLPLQAHGAPGSPTTGEALAVSRQLADRINADLFTHLEDAAIRWKSPLESRLAESVTAHFDLGPLSAHVYADHWPEIQRLGLAPVAHAVASGAVLHYLMQGLVLSGGVIHDPVRVTNARPLRSEGSPLQRVRGLLVTPIKTLPLQMIVGKHDDAGWVVHDARIGVMPLTTLARGRLKQQAEGRGLIEFLKKENLNAHHVH